MDRYHAAAQQKDWKSAAAAMQAAVSANPGNPDYHNLYAYSLRKGGTSEMDLVFKHYNEALRLDPKHRGAHEYLGEAYLMVGNVAKAKEHLGQLDKICFFGCSEFNEPEAGDLHLRGEDRQVAENSGWIVRFEKCGDAPLAAVLLAPRSPRPRNIRPRRSASSIRSRPAGRSISWGGFCPIAWAPRLGKPVVVQTSPARPATSAPTGWARRARRSHGAAHALQHHHQQSAPVSETCRSIR